jgi:hypothetical protein
MRTEDNGEFYIGYAPRPPRRIARTIFRAVIGLVALAIALAAVLVLAQQPFARSTFEFQQYRDFAGIIERKPYPALLVTRPGGDGYSRYLLVAPGKHGADAAAGGFEGKAVSLRGSLIYRDGQTMVELLPGSLRTGASDARPRLSPEVLGDVTLTGEIVDTKCYLGVMNPGRSKVHRDCAARCISGGIPPALVTADGFYLLVGSDGRALRHEVLGWVGETIEVQGNVERSGETLILHTETARFRRIAGILRQPRGI